MVSMLHVASAQNIAPANTTVAGSDDNGTEVGIFHGSDFISRYTVSPLTNGTSIPDGGVRGNVTLAVPDNQLGIQSSDVVIISCDPYMGNLQPSSVFQFALDRDPAAIVLYSIDRGSCELSGSATAYDRIYTMRNSADSRDVESDARAGNAEALVGSSETVANASVAETETSNSNSGNGSGQSSNNTNSWGPSPSTAVAMIM